MYLLGWFTIGFLLASFAMYFGRRMVERRFEPWTVRQLATELIHFGGPSDEPEEASARLHYSGPSRLLTALGLCAVLIMFLILISFAIGSDRAALYDGILWLRSPFLGVRFQYLFWGGVVGVLTQMLRGRLSEIARRLFDATIGSSESTAWVLQGALALLILAGAVIAIKPDLLTYLRSFEYGGFKATFADHSTTTRLADLNFTLEQYERFEEDYLGADSDRAKFGDMFAYNKVSSERKAITATLLGNYVQPIVKTLICLEKHHSVDIVAHDVALIKFGARWTQFLRGLKSDGKELKFELVQPFLDDVSRLGSMASQYVNAIAPDCEMTRAVSDTVTWLDATTIVTNYNRGLLKLKQDGKTIPSFRVLALIDAYFVGAVGDLLVVLQGQQEKSAFLTGMLERFGGTDEMMTPAVINVFYQTADAQLKSFRDWPVEGVLANVDYAIKGANRLISKTSDLLEECRRDPSQGDATGDAERFFGAMNRNLMILLAEKLGFFNQRALAGEPLSQAGREDWIRTYSQIIANFSARADAPILALDNLPPAAINERSKKMWPSMPIQPEYLVDIDLAIAISSLLLEPNRNAPSALSCNTALYYLNRARSNAREFIDRKTIEAASSSARRVEKVKLTDLHLRRILETIRSWAATSCEWPAEFG